MPAVARGVAAIRVVLASAAFGCAASPLGVCAQMPAPSPVPSMANVASPVPLASASPGGLTGGSPAPVADPAITARALEWLRRLQTGSIDRSQLNAAVNGQLTETLTKSVAAQVGPLGTPTAFALFDRRSVAGTTAYMYRATFASSSLFFVFALDQAGKISGLRFLPAT
jgi:hypothetical protein